MKSMDEKKAGDPKSKMVEFTGNLRLAGTGQVRETQAKRVKEGQG